MSDNIDLRISCQDHHGDPCMHCRQEDGIHQCHISEARLFDDATTSDSDDDDIVLPLHHGLVSSEDELHTVEDINAKLNMPTATGFLPIASTLKVGEWDFTRVNNWYSCLVHQPTGVVFTHGSSVQEAYDRARDNYDPDVLNIEMLDEYIDDSCEMVSEHDLPDCHDDEPLNLTSNTSASVDNLPPVHKIVSEVERLCATVSELTAELQCVKEAHQKQWKEQQQRRRVDAGCGQPITVNVDGPSRNTRSAKRVRRV